MNKHIPVLKLEQVAIQHRNLSGLLKPVFTSVDLEIRPDEVTCLVGYSGSGKTTLARTLMGIHHHYTGNIFWNGVNIKGLDRSQKSLFRKSVQYIFQDPFNSLNPKISAFKAVSEGLISFFPQLSAVERKVKAESVFFQVGLNADDLGKKVRDFSGGQRQRIAIARALLAEPEVLICDEIVSALDPSLRSQIINLLFELKHRMHIAILFISHDIPLVRMMGNHIYEIRDQKLCPFH